MPVPQRKLITQGFVLAREFSPARSCMPPPVARCRRHSLLPKGVELAKNFLDDKFERTSDRLFFAQMMGELGEMTFHSRQFFRNVGTVGEKENFLGQPLIIPADRQTGFFNSFGQGRPEFLNNGGMKLANFLEQLSNSF